MKRHVEHCVLKNKQSRQLGFSLKDFLFFSENIARSLLFQLYLVSNLSAEDKGPFEKFGRKRLARSLLKQNDKIESHCADKTMRQMYDALPMRSSLSTATVSKARLIIGCSSRTSLKLSTLREYRRQYVSARTLAVLRPRVNKQISGNRRRDDDRKRTGKGHK